MNPTGTVVRTRTGFDLVVPRTFRAPVADVWASVTEPERTARWFGTWRGEPGAGNTIDLQMGFEEGEPWLRARIVACEPPRRLALSMGDSAGDWDVELLLAERDGLTELRLVQHRADTKGVGDFGPGWEYYLDLLVASREGGEKPQFGSYHPSQCAWYVAAGEAAERTAPEAPDLHP